MYIHLLDETCKGAISVFGLILLEKIGRDLDEGVYPIVHDGGIVEPDQSCGRLEESGKEGMSNGQEAARRPAAGPRKRTTGRPWSSGGPTATRPGSASASSSILSQRELSKDATADLDGVAGAYPQVQFRSAPDVVWLLNWINPIRGLDERTLLVTAYPFDRTRNIVSWSWSSLALIWIGPRHTNYPDGSICSFEPTDRSWQQGQSLTTLLDLHVVWVARHIFMRRFGHWPGQQIFHTAWERLNEHLPGELCGGCDSGRRYEDCCRPFDQAIDPMDRWISFMKWTKGKCDRRVPTAVRKFVYGIRKTPPSLRNLDLRPRTEMFKRSPISGFFSEN